MLAGAFSGCIDGNGEKHVSPSELVSEQVHWISVPNGASFTGKPSYISEFQADYRDNGGPVSDYGSWCGAKADVDDLNFGGIRHYSCVTGTDVVDYTRTGLAGISNFYLESAGGNFLSPCKSRNVTFDYFGWNETANCEGWGARVSVFFVERNVYLMSVNVKNIGESRKVSPVIVFNSTSASSQITVDGNCAVLNYIVAYTAGINQNWLAIAPSFQIAGTSGESPYTIKGKEMETPAGGEASFWVLFAYSPDSQEDAVSLANSEIAKIGGNINSAYEKTKNDWENFFASLPKPHVSKSEFVDLYKMSATALKMDLYAPRNNMTGYGCVPSKVHYNWFWLWDTGFQALGYKEMDPKIAEEVTLTMFGSQLPDGYIAHMTNDQLMAMTPHSQSPVFGYTSSKVAEQIVSEEEKLGFEKKMYDMGEKYISWWETERDMDHDGLFEFMSQDEGGWDNSPRKDYYAGELAGVMVAYVGSIGEVLYSLANPLDCVDLNPWMYFYFKAMEKWAKDLGDSEGEKYWNDRADELGEKIDEILWNEEQGCWFDAMSFDHGLTHEHVKVLTPAIWFPAFAGTTKDEVKIRRVIEEHLLDPQEFFGKYPIPTVAYNDPYYDSKTPGWRSFIWLCTTYSALETLYKYGYEQEASEVRNRTLTMMVNQDGMQGIWETYDPILGKYKNEDSTGGYCTFQFGWSAAFTMEMILERYQRERYVMNDTGEINGYVKNAKAFSDDGIFYTVDTGEYEAPHVSIISMDGEPLLRSSSLKMVFTDEYGNIEHVLFNATISGKPFSAQLGRTYLFENGEIKDVTPVVGPETAKRWIPGFDLLTFLICILGLTALSRRLIK